MQIQYELLRQRMIHDTKWVELSEMSDPQNPMVTDIFTLIMEKSAEPNHYAATRVVNGDCFDMIVKELLDEHT